MIMEEKFDMLQDTMQKLAYMQLKNQMMLENLGLKVGELTHNVNNLGIEMKDFKEEMKKDREEMTKDREEMKKDRQDFKEEMKKDRENFKEEMKKDREEIKDFKEEMKKDREEMKKDRKEMNKKWGELSNKWGTILEDMVIPNIKSIGEKYFALFDCEDFMVRRTKRNSKDRSKTREFDIVALYEKKILINETKATPKQDYINNYIDLIKNREIFDYFPEYDSYEIIPIFSTLYFPEETVKYLSKNNIYAMGIKEDTMDILNFEEIKK